MKILKYIIPSWGLLGIYRGINLYNHNYKMDYKKYVKEPQYYTKPEYFYFANVPYGIFGLFIYYNPIFLPIVLVKEVYRLEVNIRGLNEEKEKENYNDLLQIMFRH